MSLMNFSSDELWPIIFISKCTLNSFAMHDLALISSIIKDIMGEHVSGNLFSPIIITVQRLKVVVTLIIESEAL